MERAIGTVQRQAVITRYGDKVKEVFGAQHIQAAFYIANNESGFRLDAVNKSSGACGIAQALPCAKMGCKLEFSDMDCQINWMVKYIAQRYGTPLQAQAFWAQNHWY